MKLHLVISLVIFSFFIFSCKDTNVKEEPAEIQNQTPETLDESKAEISAITKRYASNIVDDLFNEAVRKDNNLKKLTENLDEIGKIKHDSLKTYNEYLQNNNMYWSSANSYINMISDSILKGELKEIFKNLESQYKTTISKQTYLIEKIAEKEKILNNYKILMKLSITIPMINNYQKNELPDTKPLNNLVEMYDNLINETKEYSATLVTNSESLKP